MPNIEVNGVELYYEESGPRDTPVIVFSHSLFFDRRMFRHQIERFSEDYRVVVYDHRGQGGRQDAPLESLDMDTLAEDAAALIEALDLAPCHFVGNSMGGFIAFRLAARRSDLLRSAVAMGSSAEEEYKKEDFGPLVSHMQEHGTTEVIDSLMYIMFGDSTMQDPEKERLREEWRDYMLGLPSPIGDAAHGVVYRQGVLAELPGADGTAARYSGRGGSCLRGPSLRKHRRSRPESQGRKRSSRRTLARTRTARYGQRAPRRALCVRGGDPPLGHRPDFVVSRLCRIYGTKTI